MAEPLRSASRKPTAGLRSSRASVVYRLASISRIRTRLSRRAVSISFPRPLTLEILLPREVILGVSLLACWHGTADRSITDDTHYPTGTGP
jgi:hypothetical protein